MSYSVTKPASPEFDTDPGNWAIVHQSMLGDSRRLATYTKALTETVKPGDVVVDLGAGTGILSMAACQAGAARVYAVEHNPAVASIARRLIRDNGFEDRIVLLEGDGATVRIDEPIDVIVSETLGTFGTDEGIAEMMRAHAKEQLAPGGRVIPQHLRTFIVPVQYADEFRGVWRSGFMGFDLRAGAICPSPARPLLHFFQRRPLELGRPALITDIRLGEDAHAVRDVTADMLIERSGILQGFVGYFVASFGQSQLSNYPSYEGCNWSVWNWPVQPLEVNEADRLRIRLLMDSDDSLQWRLVWERIHDV